MKNKWLYLFFFIAGTAIGQTEFKVTSSEDRILIGDQFELELSATVHPNDEVLWPKSAAIGYGMLLNRSGIDTVQEESTWKLIESWTVTSFDSGFVVVPPISITINGQIQESEPLLIQVDLPKTQDEYYDIVDPLSSNRPWWVYGLWLLAAIAVAFVVSALLHRIFKNKEVQRKPKDPRTYTQKVHDALQKIHDDTLWEDNSQVDSAYGNGIRVLYAFIRVRLQTNTAVGDFSVWKKMMEAHPKYNGNTEELYALIASANEVRFGGLKKQAEEHQQWILQLQRWIDNAVKTETTSSDSVVA